MNLGKRFKGNFSQRRRDAAGERTSRSRFTPVFETLLGVALLLGLSAFTPSLGWGLLNLQPHPLWIVILAIAVRYGGGSGYFAGGVTGAVYALLLWTRPEAHRQPLETHMLIQPFLMFATGGILGEIARAREAHVADLEHKLQNGEKALVSLWDRYKILEKAKTDLEKQVTFQGNSLVALSALGQRLQNLNPPGLHRAILEMVSTVLEVQACSLYLYQDGSLWLEAGMPEDSPTRPLEMRADDPLIGRVIRERKAISIRDHLNHNKLQSAKSIKALMAGPLVLQNEKIYGVVIVESARWTAVNPVSMARFDAILKWAMQALENALLYEDSQFISRLGERSAEKEVDWVASPGAGHDKK